MKAFKTIVVLAVFFALTACGGGGFGSGSGGNGSGSTPTLVGYEITASSSAGSIQGEVYLNSVYSDGSVKTTFSISGVQGPNGMAKTTISGTTYIFYQRHKWVFDRRIPNKQNKRNIDTIAWRYGILFHAGVRSCRSYRKLSVRRI